MVRMNIFNQTQARKVVNQKGEFSVIEYVKDLSVTPATAASAYFMGQMGVRKRQVVADLNNSGIILQAGAMQMISGNVQVATNVQGVGGFFKGMLGGAVTGESAIKPRYTGVGKVILEPTYKYILLEDLAAWNGGMTIEDGLARSNISSAIAGGEGLFNNTLYGQGIAVLESPVPADELFVFDLDNDTLKIDGNMAIAWSQALQFTVERTTKTLVGSAASGEGLVNVYRGTGRVLVAPVG